MAKIVKAYGNEWNPQIISEYYNHLEGIGVGEWGYNIYRNQIEIVNAEGMLESYATTGLPVTYSHWSYGKRYLANQKMYERGMMGLAYEIVINSDPCISCLMEENSLTMQVLVMAHACIGHNHFFKNNHMFTQWTMADYIIDYMRYAKNYVERCEERYGYAAVEETLDAAHALAGYSVDKYTRKKKTKKEIEDDRLRRLQFEQANYNLDTLPEYDVKKAVDEDEDQKIEETENLLYFIEKNAPALKDWQRELVRIVRRKQQYFYPQRYTQVMNEGCATATHYWLLQELYERGLVDEAFMLEFLASHSNVVFQPAFDDSRFSGINPYKLGWEMFMDIRRMCEAPNEEDKKWFPHIVGQPFWPTFFDAVENYKDESFILQYLSPNVIRKMRLFSLYDGGEHESTYKITDIHNEDGYRSIREQLSRDHDHNLHVPHISVVDVRTKEDRRLILRHRMRSNRPLDQESGQEVLRHLFHLWKFPVEVRSEDESGTYRDKIIFRGDD